MRSTLAALILLGSAATACEDRRVVGAGASAGTTGTGAGVGAGTTGTGIGAGQTGAGSVISCGATCATPAGTVQPVNTPAEVYAAMQGSWLFCGGWPPGALPRGAVGVEFGPASAAPVAGGTTAGGEMFYLVAGPSGPVRGQGAAYELTYDVSPETPIFAQLNMHAMPMSGFGGSVRYSPCPTELQLNINASNAVLVPVGGAASVAPTPPAASAGPPPTVPAGCAASCGGPRGKPAMLGDTDAIYAAVAGSWRFCGGWPAAPSGAVGVEFGPASSSGSLNGGTFGGNMYYLVAGPSGPVRGQGFDYQLTYDAAEGQLNMHPGPNSGFTSGVAFSPCPVELDLSIAYMSTPVVLVPFE